MLGYLEKIWGYIKSKYSHPYNKIILAIIILLSILIYLNKKHFIDFVHTHPELLNYTLILLIIVFFIILITYYIFEKILHYSINNNGKKAFYVYFIIGVLILLSIAIPATNHYYFPKPLESQFLVAISPFSYIDEYGEVGYDFSPAIDLKDKIEGMEDSGLKVIILESSISNEEEAKFVGKTEGAHFVVYGEIKNKYAGDFKEINYKILPVQSLWLLKSVKPTPKKISSKEEQLQVEIVYSRKSSYKSNETIEINEYLNNSLNTIYIIAAFEKFDRGDINSAKSLLKSIDGYENNSLFFYWIAKNYYFHDKFNESLYYYERAIRINPEFEDAWYCKGVSLFQLDRYEDALVAFEKAIEIDSHNVETWYYKSIILSNLNNYSEALEAINTSIELEQNDVYIWTVKGIILRDWRKYDEALVSLEKAIEINPKFIGALFVKGTILYVKDDYEGALEVFDKAIEATQQDYYILYLLKASTLNNLGRDKEALESIDKALLLESDNAEILNLKGIILNNLGEYEEARKSFETAHKFEGKSTILIKVK